MKQVLRRIGCLLVPILVAFTAGADEAAEPVLERVQFYYEHFPPYTYHQDGLVTGTVIQATLPILEKAHLEATWQQATFGRIIRDIESGKMAVCATGYNGRAIEERSFYASMPFTWISGTVLMIVKQNSSLFAKHKAISEIMSDTLLRGAFLNGANYRGISGDPVSKGRDRHIFVGGNDTDLATLVARGRVHFAPVTMPQIAYFRSLGDIFGNLEAYAAEGLRAPRPVGIVCSRSVGRAIWQRIEAAVPPLMPYGDHAVTSVGEILESN